MAKKNYTGPEFEVTEISPETALQWLEKNTSINRALQAPKVDKLLAEMPNWMVTHEPVAFDWDGNLIDGQHRLAAIVKFGKPVTMLVARNCDPESFKKIGCGSPRNSTDLFTIFYKQKYNASPSRGTYITSVATAMLQRLVGTYPGREQIAEHAIKHYKLIVRVMDMVYGRGGNKAAKAIFGTPSLGAFANACLYFGETRVMPLMERIGDQAWTGATDPLKTLFDKLTRLKIGEARDRRIKLAKNERYAVTVAAIRSSLAGRNASRLEVSTQDIGDAEMDRRIRRGLAVRDQEVAEVA